MIVQWCLKGVSAQPGVFGDPEAIQILQHQGLTANWVRFNGGLQLQVGWPQALDALSGHALAAHVNAYATVAARTPYISLTAGVIERDPWTRVAIFHPAWATALDFATGGGQVDGYVFECWVLVSPSPAPELPGFAEEVRDLNLYSDFSPWHHEGEVAAKLVVPPRQIRRVLKYSAGLAQIHLPGAPAGGLNPDFVPPERISNIRPLV